MSEEEKRLLVLKRIAEIEDQISLGDNGEINTIDQVILNDLISAKWALIRLLGDPLED